MNRPLLQVVSTPRLEGCTAKTVWDGETAVLRCSFAATASLANSAPATLREHLDENLRIRPTPPRLVIGDVDIAYRDEWHIDSIDFRTNPSAWKKEPIDDVRTHAAPAWVAFEVDYDANGIFALDLPILISWDAVASRLALRFGATAARNWFTIADSVAVGTSVDGALAELHFSAVEIFVAPSR